MDVRIEKMILCNDRKKKWYRQRANLCAKGRKSAREGIKGLEGAT